jgi:hypothetical protein
VKTISVDHPNETITAIKLEERANLLKFQDLYGSLNKVRTKKNEISLSIILPMYNEEQSIKNVLDTLPSNNSSK